MNDIELPTDFSGQLLFLRVFSQVFIKACLKAIQHNMLQIHP